MNKAETLIEKLMNYYGVFTISDLAIKMNTTQPTISNWKSRNSITAIKKRCRELGIYDEIFTENQAINSSPTNIGQSENIYKDVPEFLLMDIQSLLMRCKNKSDMIVKLSEFIHAQRKKLDAISRDI